MHECSVHAHVLITVPCIVQAVCVFVVALIRALMKCKLRKENKAENEHDLFLRFSTNSSFMSSLEFSFLVILPTRGLS